MVYWGVLLKIKRRIRSWSLVATLQNILYRKVQLDGWCGNSGIDGSCQNFPFKFQRCLYLYATHKTTMDGIISYSDPFYLLSVGVGDYCCTWPHSVTQTHTPLRTLCKTLLDDWSASCRDLYLLTHNIHKRQTSMPPARFEPAFPAGERADLFLRTRGHRNRFGRDNTSK